MRRLDGVGCHILLLLGTWLAAPAVADPLPKVALIIDDVGYRLAEGQRAVRLPGAVAMAVLPFGTHSIALATEAEAQGKEVVLHLPMQPLADAEDPGPGALDVGQSRAELAIVLAADLAAVPFAVGVSNHMGSLLTQRADQMGWLMEELRRREPLFFIDSYTSAGSVGLAAAHEYGVPALRRDVFLDADPAPGAIEAQWRRLLARARVQGAALGIGHPYAATLALLERELPALAASGVMLVPLSALLQRGAP